MFLIIDLSYLSYKWAMSPLRDELLERLLPSSPMLCCDSSFNLRMHTYSWYKSNRGTALPEVTQELGRVAKAWQREVKARYPHLIFEEHGLEGDDIIAQHAGCNECMIMTEDHDMLQLSGAFLINQRYEQWDISRIKQKRLPLKQGESYLTYQLLTGCRTDTVPRTIFPKDRYTAEWVFTQPSPLRAALMLLPEELARRSLDCLLIPTPLISSEDSIQVALQRYPEVK